MLHQVFDQFIYKYQYPDFINHARTWFDGTADLHWTNELRALRNSGDLDKIEQFCPPAADHSFVHFLIDHSNLYLQQQYNDFQQHSVLIGIWPFAMTKNLCHATHNHLDSTFSGTYYVDVPPGSGAIHFHDQLQVQSIMPGPGMLLIWPSPLVHSVPKCEFVGTRQAISFDIALANR